MWSAASAYSDSIGLPGKAVPRAAKTVRYVYLFGGSGDFARISLDGMKVAAFGRLSELGPVRELIREYEPDAGPVLANLRYDPARERVYAVVVKPPRTAAAPGDRPDFAILVLDLPSMTLIKHVDVEMPVHSPAVLVSDDGARLLVSYSLPATGRFEITGVLEQYDTGSWERVRVRRDTIGGPQAGVHFSEDAYFAADGQVIYDNCMVLRLADDKLLAPPQKPPERWLTAAQASGLKRHGVDPHTPHVEQRAGRMCLFDQPNQSATKDVVWAVSAATHAMSAIIEVPRKSAVSLLAGGTRLLVEEPMGPLPGEKEPRLEVSGALRVYDLATGTVLTKWKMKEIAASGTPAGSICATPDGNTLFYLVFGDSDGAVAEDVYALDLVRHVSRCLPMSGLRLEGEGLCVFADR